MTDSHPFGDPLPTPDEMDRKASARAARHRQRALDHQTDLLRPVIDRLRAEMTWIPWNNREGAPLKITTIRKPRGYNDIGRQLLSNFLAESGWTLAPGTVWADPDARYVRSVDLILVPLSLACEPGPHPARGGIGRKGG